MSKSIAHSIGSGIGKSAAFAGHAAVVAVQSTGRFGQDVLAGTHEGYVTKRDELAAKRASYIANLPAQHKVRVAVKAKATA